MRNLAGSRLPRFPRPGQVWSVMVAVLRGDPRVMRRMPLVLGLIAVGLTAWVFELGAVLESQVMVRDWSSVWVGLDIMEILGLIATALLLKRRSAYLSAVAAATATLFAIDAWFDVLTSTAGSAWYESLAAAAFAEIPLALVLVTIAAHAAKHPIPFTSPEA